MVSLSLGMHAWASACKITRAQEVWFLDGTGVCRISNFPLKN